MDYIKYRFLWFVSQFLPFGQFLHVDIELTNKCNQKCLSCWHYLKPKFFLCDMEKESAYRYLSDASLRGAVSVKFNWRGESTLYKHLVDCIRRAKDIGYIDIALNTNGQFDLLLLDKLNEAGLTRLIISVDSFDCESYCKIHNCKPSDFYKLLNLLDLLKLNNYQFKVILNYHVNDINKNDSMDLYKKYHMFKLVKRYTESREGRDISIKRKRKRKKYCPHMWRRLTISSDGKIYPCCVAYNEPVDLFLGRDILTALMIKRRMILDYKKGILSDTCIKCTSGDIWKK